MLIFKGMMCYAEHHIYGVTLETARTYLHKGDTVAVVRVHIRVNLEDETCELCLLRLYDTGLGLTVTW